MIQLNSAPAISHCAPSNSVIPHATVKVNINYDTSRRRLRKGNTFIIMAPGSSETVKAGCKQIGMGRSYLYGVQTIRNLKELENDLAHKFCFIIAL